VEQLVLAVAVLAAMVVLVLLQADLVLDTVPVVAVAEAPVTGASVSKVSSSSDIINL
jgi:hypothetical protein